MQKLTRREREVLKYIEAYHYEMKMSPSFGEIKDHFGFGSLNSVTYYAQVLKEKGYVDYTPGKSRSIVPRKQKLPILYEIPAGNPKAIIKDVEDNFDWEALGIDNTNGDKFALRVRGNSMINRGIFDGDIVVVRMTPDVTEREVAVVRVGLDTTLKCVKKEEDCVRLIPANDAMKPITVTPDEDFEIIGKVIRLFRKEI